MKKRLLVATAAMLVVGLASCGETQTSQDVGGTYNFNNLMSSSIMTAGGENVKIEVWSPGEEEPVMNDVIAKWNSTAPDALKFEIDFKPIGGDVGASTVATDPTNAAALFQFVDDQTYSLTAKNYMWKPTGVFKDYIEARSNDIAIECASLAGELRSFPIAVNNGYFLYYNKAKLAEGAEGKMESILETASELNGKVYFNLSDGWYANSVMMATNGTGSLKIKYNEAGLPVQECDWDNETGVQAVEQANALLAPHYAAGTLINGDQSNIDTAAQNGTLVAAVSGTWKYNDLKSALGDDLACTKLPTMNLGGSDKQLASFTGVKNFGVNAGRSAQEQITAARLASLLVSTEAQLVRYEKNQDAPMDPAAVLDARYTSTKDSNPALIALNAQAKFAAVQSQSAGDVYWDQGAKIGNLMLGVTPIGTGETWATTMKTICDLIREVPTGA